MLAGDGFVAEVAATGPDVSVRAIEQPDRKGPIGSVDGTRRGADFGSLGIRSPFAPLWAPTAAAWPWPWAGLGSHQRHRIPCRSRPAGGLRRGELVGGGRPDAGLGGPNSLAAGRVQRKCVGPCPEPKAKPDAGPRGIPRMAGVLRTGKMPATSPQCGFLHYPWSVPERARSPSPRNPGPLGAPAAPGPNRPPWPARR